MGIRTTFFVLLAALAAGALRGAPVSAVATTGMVAELVRGVGGERVEVRQLMGAGVDPHLYKPTAQDASRLAKADAIFYNGLNLESRMGELFGRLAQRGGKVFAVTDSIPKALLPAEEGAGGMADPHVWFDAALWAEAVPAVVGGLCEVDPEGEESYVHNGKALRGRLLELDAWCKAKAAELPQERRVLVTSHDAFGHFGRAYGFEVVGLQGASTVYEASLADVSALADFLKRRGAKAVFLETSVNPGTMRRVAEVAGAKVGGELFSDALGQPGDLRGGFDTGTYDGAMRHNMSVVVEALKP
jgi:manganese/zinc/iron transport system substrate-binding protein